MVGVYLYKASQNPYYNDGEIIGTTGIYAANVSGVTWTVTNGGTIIGTADHGVGVDLAEGTFVNNGLVESTGAHSVGVFLALDSQHDSLVNNGAIDGGTSGTAVTMYAGAVTNNGHINGGFTSTGIFCESYTTIHNNGSINGTNGIAMDRSGPIYNGVDGSGSSALIYGEDAIYIGSRVANFARQDTKIENFGTIVAKNIYDLSASVGIQAYGGISLQNGSATDVTATLDGHYGVAIDTHSNGYVYGHFSTINNFGTIKGEIIVNAGTISNANLIDSASIGIYLAGGSPKYFLDINTVSNTGLIKGVQWGVDIVGASNDALSNAGVIEGRSGVFFGGGTAVNTGSIYGGVTTTSPAYAGVVLTGAGGTGPTASVLQNHGFIQGPTGVIATSATVDNFGEIVGTYGPAIQFDGLNNRLIIEAGSSVQGVAQATADLSNILELGSTPAHGGGLVTGLGVRLVGFETLDVDASAHWTLYGANTCANETVGLGAGSKLTVLGGLTDSGTLTIEQSGAGAGGTVAVTGYVDAVGGLIMHGADTLSVGKGGMVQVGAGTGAVAGRVTVMHGALLTGSGVVVPGILDRGHIDANGALTVTGEINGSGSVTVESGSTLTVRGSLDCAKAIFASGSGAAETLALGKPAASTATISGFAGSDAIDLLGLAANGESFSGGVLTLTESGATVASLKLSGTYASTNFVLASDGAGGTKVTYVAGASELPAGPGPSPGGFVSAMAAMAPSAAQALHLAAEPWRAHGAMLASPAHVALA